MHHQRRVLSVLGVLLITVFFCAGCQRLGLTSIPMEELKEKYTDENSRFLEHRGMKIHYRDEGSGPALVLIHGVCASLHTWDGWVEELKDDYRIIRMDLPGFGLNPLTDIQFIRREAAIQLLDEIVGILDLDKFSLAGNSLGGYISWTYAETYPEKVDRLILVDPAGYPMDFPWLLSFASNPLVRPFSRQMMPKFIFNLAVSQVYGDKSRVTDQVRDRYFELAMRPGGKDDYVDIFTVLKKELRSPELNNNIDQLRVPLLVMWGDKDIWIPYEDHFPRWQADYPEAAFITYEGVGHVAMEEIPEITARDADRFLSGELIGRNITR